MAVKHAKTSAKADSADTTLVRPTDWNANHTVEAGTITDTEVAAANKDGADGTASMRTLGTGAAQAAKGTHTTPAATASTGGHIAADDQKQLTYYDAGSSGAAKTIDWANGDVQKVTMTGNCTFTFSNPVSGHTYQLRCLQDGTGSRTGTFPATVRGSGGATITLTTTAGKTDYLTFFYDSTAVKYDFTFVGNF